MLEIGRFEFVTFDRVPAKNIDLNYGVRLSLSTGACRALSEATKFGSGCFAGGVLMCSNFFA